MDILCWYDHSSNDLRFYTGADSLLPIEYSATPKQHRQPRLPVLSLHQKVHLASQIGGCRQKPALYQHGFVHFAGKALLIGCEVNTMPPNPGSMRFHERLGFSQVGTQTFQADYAVTYLARRLSL